MRCEGTRASQEEGEGVRERTRARERRWALTAEGAEQRPFSTPRARKTHRKGLKTHRDGTSESAGKPCLLSHQHQHHPTGISTRLGQLDRQRWRTGS